MLKYLLQKEFLQIRRNPFLPKLIFVFPIVIMCVMPWVMNQEVKNIRVSVVDNDRSTMSQRLVHSIEQSNYFIFSGQQPSYDAALKEIEKSRTDIVLVIPPNFSRDLTLSNGGGGESPTVLIAANAVNGTKGGIGSSYLSQIVTANVNPEIATIQSKVSTLFLYNKHLNYKVFMIPALLAIVMMLMCGFLPALNIVSEKETGTIEQINVTPVSKWAFILAKLIPYWLIGLFIVTVCLLLAWAVYGITCQGPLWLVYLLAMLLALFFSSLGLLISNYSDTMQQAIFVMWFFVVCLMLLSGLFTPTRSMPDWSYATTYVNPMHYFIDAVRTVFVRGGGFSGIAHQVLALTCFALFMGSWAVVSYKKNS
ncbi:MAG: ABC transporter permease [Prevotella sp.]|nr:ABC transporter permease [Prevotella sp.]MBQ1799306.1 ABC transporter permease [Prevotella sp.]MBQ5579206.1 ABC transporter permease [Prevotella sp.]